METKKKSSIILGIFLIITLVLVIWLIPFNLKEHWEALKNNDANIPENSGEMIIVFSYFGAIVGLGLLIVSYIPAFLVLLNSIVCLVFSIKNRKSSLKSIRILNIFYDLIFSSFIIFSVVKIVLFRTGIA